MSALSPALTALAGLLSIAFATGGPALAHRLHHAKPASGLASTSARYAPAAETTYARNGVELADVEETPAPASTATPKPKPIASVTAEKHGPEKDGQGLAGDILAREMLEGRIRAQLDTLPVCWRGEGPSGPGVAEAMYTPDGFAVVKLAPPYADTGVGACVKRRLQLAAQPFDGEPITVKVPFQL